MSGTGSSQRQNVNVVNGGFLQPQVPMINIFPWKTCEFGLSHRHRHQQQQKQFPPMGIADGPELYGILNFFLFPKFKEKFIAKNLMAIFVCN